MFSSMNHYNHVTEDYPIMLKVCVSTWLHKEGRWIDLPCRPDQLEFFEGNMLIRNDSRIVDKYRIADFEFSSSLSSRFHHAIKPSSSLEYLQLLSSELQDLITTHENNFDLQRSIGLCLARFGDSLSEDEILNLVNQADQLPAPAYLDLGDDAKLPDLTLHDREYFKERYTQKAPFLNSRREDRDAIRIGLACQKLNETSSEKILPQLLKEIPGSPYKLIYVFDCGVPYVDQSDSGYVVTNHFDKDNPSTYRIWDDSERCNTDQDFYKVYDALTEYRCRTLVFEERLKNEQKKQPKPAKKERLAPGALAQHATEKAQQVQGSQDHTYNKKHVR